MNVVTGGLRGVQSALLLALGTGVGSGLIIDGRVVHGVRGHAGGFGHLRSGRTKAPCSCGGVGCIEAIVGGETLNREYRSRGGRGDLVAAARWGDPTAASLVVLAAEVLGKGLADADALVELDRVALGDGLGTALGDLLLLQLKERCPTIEFVMAELADAAGAIGAAYAAAEQNGR